MAEIAAEQGLGGRREEMSPAEGRARMEAERAWWNDDLPAVAKSVDTAVDSDHGRVPVRLIYPTDAANPPVLIYLHGGGWVMGSLQTHHRAMRDQALASGAQTPLEMAATYGNEAVLTVLLDHGVGSPSRAERVNALLAAAAMARGTAGAACC